MDTETNAPFGDDSPDVKQKPTPPVALDRIRIGSKEFVLEMPKSYAVRHEVVGASGHNVIRGFCAAIGVCAPKVLRLAEVKPYAQHGYDPLSFGGVVFDALIAKNVPLDDIMAAGRVAWAFLTGGLVNVQEAQEKADFTGPTEDAGT